MGTEILTTIGIIGGCIFILLIIVLGCIVVAQVAWETLPFKKRRGEKKEGVQLQTSADLQTQVKDLQTEVEGFQNQLQNIASSLSDLETRVSKLENQQKLGISSEEKEGESKYDRERVTRTAPSGGPFPERPGPR